MIVRIGTAWGWRLLKLAISLVAVLTLTFFMLQLIPGDPVRQALGPDAPQSLVEERRHQLGLDLPVWEQFFRYAGQALTGDFGSSILSSQPVGVIVESRIGNTAVLVVAGLVSTMVVSILIGMWIGVITRRGRRPFTRFGFNFLTGFVAALPEFLIAVGLVFFFAVTFSFFPVAGAKGPSSFVLPTIAITLGSAAMLMRVVRSSTDNVLDQEYVLVARSKRLPNWRIYLRHALPNLLTAALTLGGLQLGAVITGTIIVENVFAIPGLGTAMVNAMVNRDFPIVQATMLIFASSVLILNAVVDLLLGLVDPRSIRKGA